MSRFHRPFREMSRALAEGISRLCGARRFLGVLLGFASPLRTSMSAPLDRHGRRLEDLRVSVTDRCNFRCPYCLPRDRVGEHSFLPKADVLSFEEIERVVAAVVELGVRKVRLTGGEPLLRRELESLVERLAAHVPELALTTNGALLAERARALKDAGLGRVTVSLDALDEAVFQTMCDAPGSSVREVLRGLEAAQRAGFSSVKVNTVVRRGMNEGQIPRLVEYFRGSGVVLRFIEFMDVGSHNGWRPESVVTKREILDVLGADFLPEPRVGSSPARYYRNARSGQRIGIIASVTEPFCGDCSRLRLTADGRLYTCLFGSSGFDLRERLRSGATDDELAATVRGLWSARSDRYSEERAAPRPRSLPLVPRVEMSTIGG